MWRLLSSTALDVLRQDWLRYLGEGLVFTAVVLWLLVVHQRERERDRIRQEVLSGDFHAMMTTLCRAEAKLFDQRAWTCRSVAASEGSWSDDTVWSETYKLRPFPDDTCPATSWIDQAQVWERAAARARRAASWHDAR